MHRCGYCQYMKPKFIQMASEYPDVIFLNVDADEQLSLVWRMGGCAQFTINYK